MRPPRLARALVRLCSDPDDRAFVLEDLADRFREVARTDGPMAARHWYWRQALSALPAAIVPDVGLLQRSWTGFSGDLRSGVRTVGRHRLYAFGVAGTLGLGLAAATVAFAVAWQVWLAPLPYPDPDRVVRLYEVEPAGPAGGPSGPIEESRRHLFSPTLLGDFERQDWTAVEAVSAAEGGAGMERELVLDGERSPYRSPSSRPVASASWASCPRWGGCPRSPSARSCCPSASGAPRSARIPTSWVPRCAGGGARPRQCPSWVSRGCPRDTPATSTSSPS